MNFDRHEEVRDFLVQTWGKEKACYIASIWHQNVKNPSRGKWDVTPLVRKVSEHITALALSADNVDSQVPVFSNPETQHLCTQWTAENIEAAGLLRFDLLGLASLDKLQTVLTQLGQQGIRLNPADLPLTDKKNLQLFQEGNTEGIDGFSSERCIATLRKLQPQSFYDLVILFALYRPGPLQKLLPVFLENQKNPKNISYIHPDLKAVLEDTKGVLVFDTQIAGIVERWTGLNRAQAENFRRGLLKFDEIHREGLRADFIKKGFLQNRSAEDSSKVFDFIARNLLYTFGKAHALAHILVSWRLAYLKANYTSQWHEALVSFE